MNVNQLEKYKDTKQKVKINLQNGRFYTGLIIKIEDNSVIFLDKFQHEMMINISSIAYIIPVDGGTNGKN